MRKLASLLMFSALLFTGCSNSYVPLQPVSLRPPVQALPQGFKTASGLLGEEVELSGIYNSSRSGASLMLRSGEQVHLTDGTGRVLIQLAGLENRSNIRVRGRLREALGYSSINQRLGLEVRQFVRI